LACGLNNFELAVLSQTLSPKIKQHLAHLIRDHCPAIKVLELYSANIAARSKSRDKPTKIEQ
jgi:hypothetical protein